MWNVRGMNSAKKCREIATHLKKLNPDIVILIETNWILLTLIIVSYRFSINDSLSQLLLAKRGIRKGDPIFPYLFDMLMEYLQRRLHQMQLNPDFNHHLKCEKI